MSGLTAKLISHASNSRRCRSSVSLWHTKASCKRVTGPASDTAQRSCAAELREHELDILQTAFSTCQRRHTSELLVHSRLSCVRAIVLRPVDSAAPDHSDADAPEINPFFHASSLVAGPFQLDICCVLVSRSWMGLSAFGLRPSALSHTPCTCLS